MLIIRAVKAKGQSSWKIKIIKEEIRMLMEVCQEIHVGHIYHEGNAVANELENFGHNDM